MRRLMPWKPLALAATLSRTLAHTFPSRSSLYLTCLAYAHSIGRYLGRQAPKRLQAQRPLR